MKLVWRVKRDWVYSKSKKVIGSDELKTKVNSKK